MRRDYSRRVPSCTLSFAPCPDSRVASCAYGGEHFKNFRQIEVKGLNASHSKQARSKKACASYLDVKPATEENARPTLHPCSKSPCIPALTASLLGSCGSASAARQGVQLRRSQPFCFRACSRGSALGKSQARDVMTCSHRKEASCEALGKAVLAGSNGSMLYSRQHDAPRGGIQHSSSKEKHILFLLLRHLDD